MRSLAIISTLLAATVACASGQEPTAGSTIYRDVTATHVPTDPDLHALDAVFVDVDHDGDLDVLVAVEGGANRLYLNNGDGRLTWVEGAFGTTPRDNEHVVSADFNGDGYMDAVFVAEDDQVHSYFLGGPGGTFTDVVAVDEDSGELVTTKTPSTPADPDRPTPRGRFGVPDDEEPAVRWYTVRAHRPAGDPGFLAGQRSIFREARTRSPMR